MLLIVVVHQFSGSKGKITLDVSGVIESIKFCLTRQEMFTEISKSNFNDYPTFTTITGGNR